MQSIKSRSLTGRDTAGETRDQREATDGGSGKVFGMPIVCKQCKEPACRDSCPVGAITVEGGVVVIDDEKCIACPSCVISCPDGAIFVHSDIDTPFKCDLCGGGPVRVRVCPKKAILFVPEHALGYAHLQEVEYWDTVLKRHFNTLISGKTSWNRVSSI